MMAFLIQRLLRDGRTAGMIPVFRAAHFLRIENWRTVSTLSWQQCKRQVSCTGTSNIIVQSSSMSTSPSSLSPSSREVLSSYQSRQSPFCNYVSRTSKHHSHGRDCYPGGQSQRSLQTCGSALYAGHNKWSKVKYIKGPKDLEKSKAFTRIGIQLKLAVKERGPNPETNSSLAALISLAKSKSMPKATIDSMIKKASTSKQGDSQLTFEVRGPANSSLLVTVLTDNSRRVRQELTQLTSKNGGVFGEQGTAMFAFEKKGVLRVPCDPEDEGSMSLDEAEEVAIDAGAEEVSDETDEDGQSVFMFICDPSDLRSVRDGLAERSLPIQSSGLEYVPQTTIALDDSDLTAVATLIDAFENHEEVLKVFDNVISKD
ncbi:translational activator of cytochrome c oxidase 1 [Strongylocentrotus purpuratus]|uniref:Translational activator of cytochrome c oxidase 1 n=1 Tax=Strongylocentrotus purpuratus TaxID=7668 RepID=A0A7M7LSF6_STRPU|nr:translational activator of cytochrome c oxidase 1 [Strongylocentrotus purpuratus]|eukprot:XP_011660547.1 PREDICTED: translational activator of cytochrome c oxidase 1 [Strongylocentrotus purpuratus]